MHPLSRMFLIEAGRIVVPDTDPMAARNTAEFRYTIPVPVILLEHRNEGLVLLDTGVEPGHFPQSEVGRLRWSEKNRLDNQLRRIGYPTDAVRHILLSHWHRDHHNQLFLFPDATVYIRARELSALEKAPRAGYPPGEREAFLRFRKECPGAKIVPLPDQPECDIFLDHSILTIDTKGHTPGHQSFLVNLENSGQWVFAADAIHDEMHLTGAVPIQRAWDADASRESMRKLVRYRENGAKLIYGHDAEQWRALNKLPLYYT